MEQVSEKIFTSEEQDIITRSKTAGGYMKAPNGQATNLNEKQWVQVRTQAFKDWFGDWENEPESASKVIDENGEPLVVYHGTRSNDDFYVFDSKKGNPSNQGGHYFSNNREFAAKFGKVIKEFFLNIKDPALGGFEGSGAVMAPTQYRDGGIFTKRNTDRYAEKGTKEYIVFNPNQIKSATDNTGEFSIWDDDIRFRKIEDDIFFFASRYNLEEADVRKYAQSMQNENLGGASYAIQEIRRKIRIDNSNDSFVQFSKRFAPIKESLYKEFGNVDELRNEVIRTTMEERNALKEVHKQMLEKTEAEKERLQEFQDMCDEQLDSEYFIAIDENNEPRMRDLVNEAAHRRGYIDIDSNYQGVGAWAAPADPGYENVEARRADVEEYSPDVNIEDIAKGYSPQPDDYFTHLKAYGKDTPEGKESAQAINKAINEIRSTGNIPLVKAYRAVPTDIKENTLRNGDWVSLSPRYAEMHGNNRLEGKYRIIEQKVPANELWWDGNDSNEWGFDDGKEYRYKNTENNRKLNDLITRDEKGNIIPLSQRFNSINDDIRFRFIGEKGAVTTKDFSHSEQIFLSRDARMDELSRHVSFLAQKQHIPVEVIRHVDEVSSPNIRGLLSCGKDIRGWYDIPSERICLYLPHARGKEDIAYTLLHEGVAHYGLRKFVGNEHMDKFLDEIFDGCGGKLRGEITNLAETGKLGIRTATEEYLAHMAENGVDVSVWDKICLAFKNLLRKLGFSIEVNERELKGILVASQKNLKEMGTSSMPERNAKASFPTSSSNNGHILQSSNCKTLLGDVSGSSGNEKQIGNFRIMDKSTGKTEPLNIGDIDLNKQSPETIKELLSGKQVKMTAKSGTSQMVGLSKTPGGWGLQIGRQTFSAADSEAEI